MNVVIIWLYRTFTWSFWNRRLQHRLRRCPCRIVGVRHRTRSRSDVLSRSYRLRPQHSEGIYLICWSGIRWVHSKWMSHQYYIHDNCLRLTKRYWNISPFPDNPNICVFFNTKTKSSQNYITDKKKQQMQTCNSPLSNFLSDLLNGAY